MAGIHHQEADFLFGSSHLSLGSMPFRYLGIPLAAAKLKTMHFEPLLDRLRTYINGWTALSLSFAGRAELRKSVLQGVESFSIEYPASSNVYSHSYHSAVQEFSLGQLKTIDPQLYSLSSSLHL